MEKLKPCPFCGCLVEIQSGTYPSGAPKIQPYGWHYDNCPLDNVLWCFDVDEGWTEEKIAEVWNRRDGEQDG